MATTVISLVRQYWRTKDSIILLKEMNDKISSPKSKRVVEAKIRDTRLALTVIESALKMAKGNSMFDEVEAVSLSVSSSVFEKLREDDDIKEENNSKLVSDFQKKNEITMKVRSLFAELLETEDDFCKSCIKLAKHKIQLEALVKKYHLQHEKTVPAPGVKETPITPARVNRANRSATIISFLTPSTSPLKLSLEVAQKKLANIENIPAWLHESFTSEAFRRYHQSQITVWSTNYLELSELLQLVADNSKDLTDEEKELVALYRLGISRAFQRACRYDLFLQQFIDNYKGLQLGQAPLLESALDTLKNNNEAMSEIVSYCNMYPQFAMATRSLASQLSSVKTMFEAMKSDGYFGVVTSLVTSLFYSKADKPNIPLFIEQFQKLIDFLNETVIKEVDNLMSKELTADSYNEFADYKKGWLSKINSIFTITEQLIKTQPFSDEVEIRELNLLLNSFTNFTEMCLRKLTDAQQEDFAIAIGKFDRAVLSAKRLTGTVATTPVTNAPILRPTQMSPSSSSDERCHDLRPTILKFDDDDYPSTRIANNH